MIKLRRLYDPPEKREGYRVLVDRLWPRGVKKEALAADAWMKDLGPSHALRKWFHHDPTRFAEFARRYRKELERPAVRPLLAELRRRSASGPLTLLYSARDRVHNQAVIIKKVIERGARSSARQRKRVPARVSG
jgi:uncharacterized protein YeaO (DUF488 family)